MPIILSSPVIPQGPSYDRVHLSELHITLQEDDYSKASISGSVRLYYQDGVTGKKYFSSETRPFYLDDAEDFARVLALSGDNRGIESIASIKSITSLLIEKATDLGNNMTQ